MGIYCMESLGRKDKTETFFEEYLKKYVIEITDFNKNIELNKDDTKLFVGAASVIGNPGFYDDNDVIRNMEVYDIFAFYQACGLINWDTKTGKIYIDPNKLAQKAFEHKKFKELDNSNTREVVSTYTKGAKK